MKDRTFLERIISGADLPGEVVPGFPLLEIVGDNRVLVENHLGVAGYDEAEICIKVRYGQIKICGACLKLCHMSRQRLVISGKIFGVHLLRG